MRLHEAIEEARRTGDYSLRCAGCYGRVFGGPWSTDAVMRTDWEVVERELEENETRHLHNRSIGTMVVEGDKLRVTFGNQHYLSKREDLEGERLAYFDKHVRKPYTFSEAVRLALEVKS